MDDIGPGDLDRAVAESNAASCWADYCPCDKSDPDYGYLDISICRDLKMGQPVQNEVFSIGAQSRDARRALREFDEQNP